MSDDPEADRIAVELAKAEFAVGLLVGELSRMPVVGAGDALWIHLRKLARTVIKHEGLEERLKRHHESKLSS